MNRHFVHPYMPNSAPSVERRMLSAVGVNSVEEIYTSIIPQDLLFKGTMNIPTPFTGEHELKKHVSGILAKNTNTEEALSFLGAGCYKRYVPAVCDEIANRAEFLTAYCGDTYSDHGKMQAIFEYASMMSELLDCDVVSYPTYDAGQAVSSSFRMALRLLSGRKTILVPSCMNPEIRSMAESYCRGCGTLVPVKAPDGLIDMADFEAKLSGDVAAVFVENPSFLGVFEPNARAIIDRAHARGALAIVMPDVCALGVMMPPSQYGADISCGEIQPLGMHMQFGSGCGGFIALADNPQLIAELPTYLYGIARTSVDGEYGWGRALYSRCSHMSRENAKEYFGTESGLWGIVAGTYLACMGPQGMKELGTRLMTYAEYAMQSLAALRGLRVNPSNGKVLQEFVVDFNATGLTVEHINAQLLEHNIFGGFNLTKAFPEQGERALYCVNDTITVSDIKTLCAALDSILRGEN
ncbi:MAG: aminomethyl-transferring glycine dehydrogenase subunit GcvPA [Pyramidobacter porci]|uniref:aminomethyl-transferring glycine dehydrogenase subunit GcvPA n=1 Tax=Pyramidobacter porci TaxID=2605789 RepID=UPI002A75E00E|nr:aminomethyl-transferring glycine dehydrogenase subunit GcvPA [Pyramidobacter porci]MDY2649331.1 aminomethyl-transferring glycine dehydrogenase subunit GcvPA [Pyramidobacter porci]